MGRRRFGRNVFRLLRCDASASCGSSPWSALGGRLALHPHGLGQRICYRKRQGRSRTCSSRAWVEGIVVNRRRIRTSYRRPIGPFGSRLPRKRGPYSTPNDTLGAYWSTKLPSTWGRMWILRGLRVWLISAPGASSMPRPGPLGMAMKPFTGSGRPVKMSWPRSSE
jgi:hypothetical protein